MSEGLAELTTKEKETLRLLLQGYDAKSCARALSLSVHTINERLRSARRKLGVSSSREAARILHEAEEHAPQLSVSRSLGAAPDGVSPHNPSITSTRMVRGWIVGGVVIVIVISLAVSLAMLPQQAGTQTAPQLAQEEPAGGASSYAADAQTVQTALEWLALVDEGRWGDSWSATALMFRTMTSVEVWSDVSVQVREPLGAVQSREFVEQESITTPPHGAELIHFKTSFTNRPVATETVSVVREDGRWKVVGYWIG